MRLCIENALSKKHFSCNLYRVQLCTDWTINEVQFQKKMVHILNIMNSTVYHLNTNIVQVAKMGMSDMDQITTTNTVQLTSPTEQLFEKRFTGFYIILSIESLAGVVANLLFFLSQTKARNCSHNTYTIMTSLSILDMITRWDI